jgi:hypothetical protein
MKSAASAAATAATAVRFEEEEESRLDLAENNAMDSTPTNPPYTRSTVGQPLPEVHSKYGNCLCELGGPSTKRKEHPLSTVLSSSAEATRRSEIAVTQSQNCSSMISLYPNAWRLGTVPLRVFDNEMARSSSFCWHHRVIEVTVPA